MFGGLTWIDPSLERYRYQRDYNYDDSSMSHGNIEIPRIDPWRLRKLTDLRKCGIDPVRLQIENTQIEAILNKIESHGDDKDSSVVLKLIEQVLNDPKQKFNFMIHIAIAKCQNLPPSITKKSMNSIRRIINRMIVLHMKECKAMISNPQGKSVQYLCTTTIERNKTLKQQSYRYQSQTQCVLCYRGAQLFDFYWQIDMHNNININYNFESNEKLIWNRLDFANKKQFRYCPFHMNMTIDSDYSDNINHGYCSNYNYNYNRYQWTLDEMIINFSLQWNEITKTVMVHNCLHDMADLILISDTKRQVMKAFEICAVVGDILIHIMKILTKVVNFNYDENQVNNILGLIPGDNCANAIVWMGIIMRKILGTAYNMNQIDSQLFVKFVSQCRLFESTLDVLGSQCQLFQAASFWFKNYMMPQRQQLRPNVYVFSLSLQDLNYPVLLFELTHHWYSNVVENHQNCQLRELMGPEFSNFKANIWGIYVTVLLCRDIQSVKKAGKRFDEQFKHLHMQISQNGHDQ